MNNEKLPGTTAKIINLAEVRKERRVEEVGVSPDRQFDDLQDTREKSEGDDGFQVGDVVVFTALGATKFNQQPDQEYEVTNIQPDGISLLNLVDNQVLVMKVPAGHGYLEPSLPNQLSR